MPLYGPPAQPMRTESIVSIGVCIGIILLLLGGILGEYGDMKYSRAALDNDQDDMESGLGIGAWGSYLYIIGAAITALILILFGIIHREFDERIRIALIIAAAILIHSITGI